MLLFCDVAVLTFTSTCKLGHAITCLATLARSSAHALIYGELLASFSFLLHGFIRKPYQSTHSNALADHRLRQPFRLLVEDTSAVSAALSSKQLL
jgi:hypothetical protein